MRAQIKNDLLNHMRAASTHAARIKEGKTLTKDEINAEVYGYICHKFLLSESECNSCILLKMAEQSLSKAADMNIIMSDSDRFGVSCGAAGSVVMKIALLLNAMRQDFGLDISTSRLGLCKTINDVGEEVYGAMQK